MVRCSGILGGRYDGAVGFAGDWNCLGGLTDGSSNGLLPPNEGCCCEGRYGSFGGR